MLRVPGPAVIGDLFALGGTDLPQDCRVVFSGPAAGVVTVRPDFVRPHWLLLAQLPPYVPVGQNQVWVEGPDGWSSARVRIEVKPYGADAVRVLCPGGPSDRPYTIAFVANPAIKTIKHGIAADPILTDRPAFRETVLVSLQALFTLDEDLLREGDLDRIVRLVTVFDHRAPPTEENALVEEFSKAPAMLPRRLPLLAFLTQRNVPADVVFAIHGSASHPIPTAAYTTDARDGPQVEWTYDGAVRSHGVFAEVPGSVALSVHLDPNLPYALHEFAHAASECERGVLLDAYFDGPGRGFPGLIVNKKYRPGPGFRVPVHFCSYGIRGAVREYLADRYRDGLKYPNHWSSYHPEPLNPRQPSLLDDFRLAKGEARHCRFDKLTYHWLRDRIWAKANR